ncbi:MAG: RsmD family RNA methyltransferase [Gemmatimonadota bacterium]
MRIVGGRHAGRKLVSPGRAVRPTPERVRAHCLDLLAEDVEGARVLDLFAGSGAIGLEAISRGARSADFVENGRASLHALKANVAALRVGRKARIFKKDVLPWIQRLDEHAYDLAWVDPPYGSRKLDRVIERWRATPFARVLVLEHDKSHEIPLRGKRYDFEGPTRITIVRPRESSGG